MNAGSCGVPRTRSPNTSYRSNPASTKTVAARFIATARRRGVSIQTDVKVECIEENEGCVSGVRLSNGATIPYDVVITGIGIVPAVTPLIAAGAAGTNGVDVDEHCRTSLVDIFSIGDCAAHCNKFANGARVRLESVQNATDQAAVVAKVIIGARVTYDSVPGFWSIQYDLRLQTVGLSMDYDRALLWGNIDQRSFSVIYIRAGRVIALDCVNAAKTMCRAERWLLMVLRCLRTNPATIPPAGMAAEIKHAGMARARCGPKDCTSRQSDCAIGGARKPIDCASYRA